MNEEFTHILIHYAEIGLKGKNRGFFESKLVDNVEKSLKNHQCKFNSVERVPGRIAVSLKEDFDKEKIREAIRKVFGVANFSLARKVQRDIEEIKQCALNLIKEEEFESFAIETIRSDKEFSLNSQEVNEKVGAHIQNNLDKEVDLDNPDQKIFCEITTSGIYVYLTKFEGPGGLPVSTAGKALVLLSGGIDSPVAAYRAAKRGVEPVYIHFHSYPYTDKKAIEKTKKLIKKLCDYTFEAELHLVPFSDIQESVVEKTEEKYRTVLYRRLMMKISEKIAEDIGAKVLVTGESIGQVASQTLENMNSISRSVDLPIVRPLVGMDKLEITQKAKEIGTYKTSIEEADDTCTRFQSSQPVTKSDLESVKREEEKLEIEKLVEEGVSNSEVIRIDCREY